MQCKFCGADTGSSTLCPECGKDNHVSEIQMEETAAPVVTEQDEKISALEAKLKRSKMIMVIAMGIALVALAVVLVLVVFNGRDLPEPEPTIVMTTPPDGNPDDETCKGSYTVSDDILSAQAGTVVAQIGNEKLTVELLQIYYWSTVRNYIGQSSSSAGFNVKQPLDTQICSLVKDKTVTWQQYFLAEALNIWHTYTSVSMVAREEGYELSEEYQKYLDELPEKLETTAKNSGYGTVDALLKADLGALATYDAYYAYMENYYLGYDYYMHYSETLEVTDEDIEAYYNANASMLDYFGVNKESGKYVDVRHILIQPESSKDADGKTVYTEEAWEACRKKAQEIYDQWLAENGDEDAFAELAKKHSACGSAPDGGLLDTFGPGEMVEEFEQWSINEDHEYGDHDMIKTSFGYHIMFYVDGEEMWISASREGALGQKLDAWLEQTMEENAMTVTYSDIILANVTF